MLSLPPALMDAIKAQVSRTCVLVELDVVDSGGNPSTKRWVDIDTPVWYNGNRFDPFPFTLSPPTFSTLSVDSVELELDNVSLMGVGVFLNAEQRGRTGVVLFGAVGQDGKLIGAYEAFKGFIDSIEIKEEESTSTAIVKLTHELAYWRRESLRPQTAKCPWRFKDSDCGYTGTASWCDKTWTRCQALGNIANFGGFPHLEEIEGKEIWWGRKPK